jgi:hypothetical protein
MTVLPNRLNATISMVREIKPRWEPGPGLKVVNAEFCDEGWIVNAQASGEARCPSCRLQATRRHSFYMRRLQDLPPLCQTSCRLNRIGTIGGAGRRKWHDTDRRTRIG